MIYYIMSVDQILVILHPTKCIKNVIDIMKGPADIISECHYPLYIVKQLYYYDTIEL